MYRFSAETNLLARQARRIESPDRHAVGVRGLRDRRVAGVHVELERLEAARSARILQPDRVEELGARRRRQALRDVDEDLAALDAGEAVHRGLQRVHRELKVVAERLRVGARRVDRLLLALRVVDPAERIAALARESRPAAGLHLGLFDRRQDVALLGREPLLRLQRPVVGHDHGLRLRSHGRRQKFLQAFEHPVSVLRLDVLVVDVHDVPGLELGGNLIRGGRRVERHDLAVFQQDLPSGHGVKVGDHLRHPVLEHLEVVPRQVGDPIPLRVGDDDVDVRDRNFHPLRDGRHGVGGVGFRSRRGRLRGPRGRRRGGRRALPEKGRGDGEREHESGRFQGVSSCRAKHIEASIIPRRGLSHAAAAGGLGTRSTRTSVSQEDPRLWDETRKVTSIDRASALRAVKKAGCFSFRNSTEFRLRADPPPGEARE